MTSQSRETTTQPPPPALQHRPRLFALATTALVTLAFFLATAWLLPLITGHDIVGDTISEMALGPGGFVLTIAFVSVGIGILCLAVVIRAVTAGERGSALGSLLVAIYGVGAILAGVFPTERIDAAAEVWQQSATGLIHVIASLVSFIAIVIGIFVLGRTFLRMPSWRTWGRRTMLFAGGALALLFVQSEGPFVGIMQRGFVTIITVWLIVVAIRARRSMV